MKNVKSASQAFPMLVLMALLATVPAMAQHNCRMIMPDTTQRTSRTVSITLDLSSELDTNSVQWNRYNYTIDSNYVSDPTVMVIPEHVYSDTTYPANEWHLHSIEGVYTRPADSILVYTVSNMNYSTAYIVIIKGLKVLDSLGVSQNVNTLIHRFSIVDPLPYAQASSVGEGGTIFIDDTVKVMFDAKIEDVYIVNDKVSTALGPILEFQQISGLVWTLP